MDRPQFGIGLIILGIALFMFMLGASVAGSSQPTTQASPIVSHIDEAPTVAEPQVIRVDPIQIEVTVKYPEAPEPTKVEVAQAPVVAPQVVAPVVPTVVEPTPDKLYKVTHPTTPTPYVKPVIIAPVQVAPQPVNTPLALSTPYTTTGVITTKPQATAISPCANRLCTSIHIDFTGAAVRNVVNTSCNVAIASSAWDCLQQAIGSNIQYKDFGGSLGIFVEGLYGVKPSFASCSCYWEFTVNGNSSDEGVSAYKLKQGDIIGFRIAK